MREYERRKIDDQTVRALLDAAVAAPTAMHIEPWTFVVVQDDAALRNISDAAKAAWKAEAGKYQDLHAPHDRASGFAARLADPAFSIFYDAGTLIVVCAKPASAFVVADCWLAAENLMLAASALGLGTCVIGSALSALNAPEIKAELHIPPDVAAVAPIIVGIPAPGAGAAGAPRREPEILSWTK